MVLILATVDLEFIFERLKRGIGPLLMASML